MSDPALDPEKVVRDLVKRLGELGRRLDEVSHKIDSADRKRKAILRRLAERAEAKGTALPGGAEGPPGPAPRPRRHFASEGERRRFLEMRPITPSEIRSVDWDELLGRLTEGF